MILRPVRPASPCGPPISKRPVGLIRMRASADGRSTRSSTGRITRRSTSARRSSVEIVGECCVEMTTVSTVLGRRAVVADGHLGLAVGAQPVDLARVADLGEALGQTVRQPDRHRHQLGGLARGVAEHQALVAGALVIERIAARPLARLERVIDALGDIRRLRADRDRDAAGAAVEPDVGRVVADAGDAVAHDGRDVDVAARRDLARDVHEARGHERLDGDARRRIDGQQRVEDRVADLVADLVGVTLGDGLGREKAQRVRRGFRRSRQGRPSLIRNRSADDVEDTVGDRRLRPLSLGNYIAGRREHDDRVTVCGEALGPSDPVDDEEVDALAGGLRAAQLEQRVTVGLGLGGEADDDLIRRGGRPSVPSGCRGSSPGAGRACRPAPPS